MGLVTMPTREKRDVSNSCSACDRTWTALGAAHCAAEGCHQTFAGATLFDRHRSLVGDHGCCRNPAEIVDVHGQRLMFCIDGVWRGPAMTDQDLAQIRTSRRKATP